MALGRRWTAEEKRVILREYESAPHGMKAGVLRRHRISHSQLAQWATYRDYGILDTGWPKGMRMRMTPKVESAEIGRLQAEVNRLQAELERAHRDRLVAEAAAEALGKASALLQAMLQGAEPKPAPSSPPASPGSSPGG
jgi:transposase-like protein